MATTPKYALYGFSTLRTGRPLKVTPQGTDTIESIRSALAGYAYKTGRRFCARVHNGVLTINRMEEGQTAKDIPNPDAGKVKRRKADGPAKSPA